MEREKETFKEYASHLLTVAGRLDEYFSNSNVLTVKHTERRRGLKVIGNQGGFSQERVWLRAL